MGRSLQLRILFVAPYTPNRIRTRSFHLVKALAALGHRVTLAAIWTTEEELAEAKSLEPDLEALILERQSSHRSIANCVRALPTFEPMQAHYSWNQRFLDRIVQELSQRPYDVVHVEHLRGVRYGLAIEQARDRLAPSQPPVVWDSVDCISLLFEQAAETSVTLRSRLIAKMELPRTKRYEGRVTTTFRRVIVTSEADRSALLELSRPWRSSEAPDGDESLDSRVQVVPNGVDLEYFSPRSEEHEPNSIVFSGKMSYHANVTAAVGFVNNVMPKVWEVAPEARLWIVGKDPTETVRRLVDCDPRTASGGQSRVIVTGTVSDIRPYLRRAAVAVAPLRYAVGIQNKVLEAMACGAPVVASKPAVAALQARVGRDLLVGVSDEEMATSILALLGDEPYRRRMARAGRVFVESAHDWRRIAGSLTDVYQAAHAA